MRKGIILVLLIVFLAFAGAKIVKSDAVPATAARAPSVSAGFFGGRIINTKALEIEALEGVNFECIVVGSTISIIPIGSPAGTPASYFIPTFITSKTRTTPSVGQLILGKYSTKTPITCIFKGIPPVTVVVNLDTITLFGTSSGGASAAKGRDRASAVPGGPASPGGARGAY
ncbi:MAG: hypothetical protein UT09_C0005G0011 [Parcubacteria group bacterium GW2011_GWF2_38_8]|nr:MAG: hypothetical protein UT09_C0005G0011 [Parcubacteria group bacterium GW2011_GWF2_38_8]